MKTNAGGVGPAYSPESASGSRQNAAPLMSFRGVLNDPGDPP